jgi:hypothetical protein
MLISARRPHRRHQHSIHGRPGAREGRAAGRDRGTYCGQEGVAGAAAGGGAVAAEQTALPTLPIRVAGSLTSRPAVVPLRLRTRP